MTPLEGFGCPSSLLTLPLSFAEGEGEFPGQDTRNRYRYRREQRAGGLQVQRIPTLRIRISRFSLNYESEGKGGGLRRTTLFGMYLNYQFSV